MAQVERSLWQVSIPLECYQRAMARYYERNRILQKEGRKYFEGSITKGLSLVYAYLAEEVHQWMNPTHELSKSFEHDFETGLGTLDVKSRLFDGGWTERANFLLGTQINRADEFVFISITSDFRFATLCGTLSRGELLDRSVKVMMGDPIPGSSKHKYQGSGFRVPVSRLRDCFVPEIFRPRRIVLSCNPEEFVWEKR